MARDPQAVAMQALWVAHANHEKALAAKAATRQLLDLAILRASEAGITNAEIARACSVSPQRVGRVIASALTQG